MDLPSCTPKQPADQLGWCDVRVGDGQAAESIDLLDVAYTTRADGELYRSSEHFQLDLSPDSILPTVEGWRLGTVGSPDGSIPPMKRGGIRTLRIPASLAYGEKGLGCLLNRPKLTCQVKPNATLDITFLFRDFSY